MKRITKAKFNSSQSKRKWKGPAGPNSIQVKVRSKSLSLKIILIAKESFKSSSDFRYAAWSYVDDFGDVESAAVISNEEYFVLKNNMFINCCAAQE